MTRTLVYILFSFSGHIGQKKFWIYGLSHGVATVSLTALVIAVALWTELMATFWLLAPVFLVHVWGVFAVTTKRLHDRGIGGWGVLQEGVVYGPGDESQNAHGWPYGHVNNPRTSR